jgi:phospholipid/cholesterol/gamma-HCH transport system substrate-binding protein
MRRVAVILLVLVAGAAVIVTSTGASDDDPYEVRAIFDNASFLAPDMDVRVAGANVGSVAELDVTFPDETVHEDGSPEAGKAAVVMRIDDAAFQDFREDASCTIHPQSLLGERFVDCQPTQPRAPGTEPPPELEVIPDGERGEGQRFLPLERNGKAVDLDLVNNIMREPYPDRFRLILNDLGAGLAARGEELAEIVERSNPALRETNEVLAILARQNRALESLATDSDAITSALARERDRVASFINEATTVGQATAARSAELEDSFARFPGFLRELRSTMTELRGFADESTPVFSDLGAAAPSLTRASKLLEPFSDAGTRALTTLGDAAEDAGPALAASDPVVRQTRNLAQAAAPATRQLSLVLSTMRQTGGFKGLMETIFGLGGAVNPFDELGHFARALIPTNVCFDYTSREQSGCESRFNTATGAGAARALALVARQAIDTDRDGGRSRQSTGAAPQGEEPAAPGGSGSGADEQLFDPIAPPTDEVTPPEAEPEPAEPPAGDETGARSMRLLLDFFLGPEGGAR